MGSWTYNGQVFPNFKSQCANLCPILNGDVSVMIHFCAGKILVQENIAPVDDYVHLVHNFKRRMTFAWHHKESFICQNWRIHKEMKYVWLSIKFNYFVLPASVVLSFVATQFHVSNRDGQMSKGVKTSQRCEWLIVTSRNVRSKINVKLSKVQIPISFLIIWIFWSYKNEFTCHMMTCLKITESQNGQIYPEDTFSHGAAHINLSFAEYLLIIQVKFDFSYAQQNFNWVAFLTEWPFLTSV